VAEPLVGRCLAARVERADDDRVSWDEAVDARPEFGDRA